MAWTPKQTPGFRGRLEQRLALIRALPEVGWPTLVAGVLLQLVAGLLPVGFIVETSSLIGHVPAAVRGGASSHAAHQAQTALYLAAAFFVAQQLLAPLQTLLVMRVTRRFDG